MCSFSGCGSWISRPSIRAHSHDGLYAADEWSRDRGPNRTHCTRRKFLYICRGCHLSTANNVKHLVPFYEKIGFKNKGRSKAQFGGGGWIDMVSSHGVQSTVDEDSADFYFS